MDDRSEDMKSVLEFDTVNESSSAEEDKEAKGGVKDVTIKELVAKARAPIKKEFLTTAGLRVVNSHGSVTRGADLNGHMISKRQLKKIRNEAKKSTKSICSVVARTRDPSKCPYGDKCLFNHNVEVYMAQKLPDLPGNCPSLETGEPCSYSITCRFAGTHKDWSELESSNKKRSNVPPNERNILRKDYQKLLWRNKGHYPRAEAQLRAMGLLGKAFKLNSAEDAEKVPDTKTVEVTVPGLSEDQKIPSTATSQVDTSQLVLSGSVTGSHPSKKPKTITNGSAAEDISDSKGSVAVEHEPGTGGGILSNLADFRSDVMDISNDGIPTSGEKSISDKLIEEKGAKKSSGEKQTWRTLYFETKLSGREKKLIDFRDKLYLAPLTTVGNLPFRRVCKTLGADITCGEMAMCRNLLQGAASEWALLRRHSSEDLFGVQICGGFPDHVARTAEMIERECEVDFIDVNVGCPIDLVVNSGAGSCLLTKPQRLEQIVRATAGVMENALTLKLRMGYYEGRNCAHTFMPDLYEWGVSAVTIHGRTRQQRYSKVANWDYVYECVNAAPDKLQVIGNGDISAYTDWHEHLQTSGSKLTTCMIARGALMKPWLFTEIKEARHWDISSSERLDILRQYVNAGLAHWGSDAKGVEVTRKFLLEWLNYTHRYIPVGLLEVVPQRMNWRPPSYFGRNELETLMASESAADWIKISEMLLGPVPSNFIFQPKHKSNAYDRAENG